MSRNDQANVIYNYLIDAASKNASDYSKENNYILTTGVEVDTTNLIKNEIILIPNLLVINLSHHQIS